MRAVLRRNAFLRMIENQFVTSEDTFVELEWYDACIDAELRPVLGDRRSMLLWVGVDASVKRDSTAIAAATFDSEKQRVRLISHKIFQPSPTDPLDFEATIEAYLRDLAARFALAEVRYDPYQMAAVAQRLVKAGLPMIEFPQTVPNLTESSTALYELIKGRNLVVYPDDDLRLAISRCVAIETARGWKISKETASAKIDVVIALAMAALGALQGGARAWSASDSAVFQQMAHRQIVMSDRRQRVADFASGGMINNVNDVLAALKTGPRRERAIRSLGEARADGEDFDPRGTLMRLWAHPTRRQIAVQCLGKTEVRAPRGAESRHEDAPEPACSSAGCIRTSIAAKSAAASISCAALRGSKARPKETKLGLDLW